MEPQLISLGYYNKVVGNLLQERDAYRERAERAEAALRRIANYLDNHSSVPYAVCVEEMEEIAINALVGKE